MHAAGRAPKDAGNGIFTRTTDSLTPSTALVDAKGVSLRALSPSASGAVTVIAPVVSSTASTVLRRVFAVLPLLRLVSMAGP